MPRPAEEPPKSRPAYFWWLLANALALCFAIVSWAVCLDVFGHPELPRNYAILGKLGRAPVLERFTVLDVPKGNAFDPKGLYRKYFGYSDDQLSYANSLLLRNYLTNFDRPLLLTYVEGDYQILEVRKLGSGDFMDPGVVIRAQALVKPDDFTKPLPYPVFVEYVLPTKETAAAGSLKAGDFLSIKKSPNCAVVVHLAKIIEGGEPALFLTVIPIAYGPYQISDSGSFEIDPPLKLRPQAGLPFFKISSPEAAQKP